MKILLLIVSMFMAMKVAVPPIKMQDAETWELRSGDIARICVYGRTTCNSSEYLAVNKEENIN